jgi:HEPN domain-containing protein
MTKNELYAKIDKAPEEEVRECLKQIITQWFVERYGRVAFDKPLGSDTIEDVTGILNTFGFCPNESHFFRPNPPEGK